VLAAPKLARVRAALAAIVVVVVTLHTVALVRDFKFVPIENWKRASSYIEHTFPDNTAVTSTDVRFASLGAPYLDERFPVRNGPNALNPFVLALGRTAVVDFSNTAPKHDLGVPGVISEVRIPQRRGQYLRLLAVPPPDASVEEVMVNGQTQALGPITDHRLATGAAIPGRESRHIRVLPSRDGASRSAVLLFAGPTPGVRAVEVHRADGSTERVAPTRAPGSGMLTIPLGDRRVDRIDLTLDRSRSPNPAALAEVWTYPARW
jgi:hypothetical protein